METGEQLCEAARNDDLAKVKSLAGAPWNALSQSNQSAGDLSMDAGYQEAFEVLLNAGKKNNVKLIFGRWQDIVSQLESYDGIFFDTYGEYYKDLREFHQHLPKLLKPGGIYSFFNGLCGGNTFFHVVYCHLVSLEPENLGYLTQLIPLPMKDCLGEEVWRGVSQKYWQLDTYYLLVCQSIQESE
ncbi:hypothetical protein like AT5G65860 [Hibiscus trionum]|uniref:Uncharacterized protein n=1 Tax=Hibiscus trionum TaxID=183268 RepID=A0A9W7M050_HIBTR|nr:hypothetical protein like AT5G65860 [Hibiscus trionum]